MLGTGKRLRAGTREGFASCGVTPEAEFSEWVEFSRKRKVEVTERREGHYWRFDEGSSGYMWGWRTGEVIPTGARPHSSRQRVRKCLVSFLLQEQA